MTYLRVPRLRDLWSPFGVPRACVASGFAGALAKARFDEKVTVVRSERNLGSAGGFALGLKTAVKRAPDFQLSLDDDNVLEAGCLAQLDAGMPSTRA